MSNTNLRLSQCNPLQPWKQSHLKDPTKFMHFPFPLHGLLPSIHSFTSVIKLLYNLLYTPPLCFRTKVVYIIVDIPISQLSPFHPGKQLHWYVLPISSQVELREQVLLEQGLIPDKKYFLKIQWKSFASYMYVINYNNVTF